MPYTVTRDYKAYQPLNTWWAEQASVVYTEFRDGNVPAGYRQLRALQASLSLLPAGVEEVRLRSDTAGYQHELLRYCESGADERFGRIEFSVGCDVTPEFRKAVKELSESDWQAIYKEFDGDRMKTNQEWAEVCFIPNAIGHKRDAPVYRYLAIREVMGSMELAGAGIVAAVLSLPDHANKFSALQAIWFGNEHGLGRREVDSLAPAAMWKIRRGSLGDEGRFGWRQVAVWRLW